MTEGEYWGEEYAKCIASPYYFYMTYVKIKGNPPTTRLNEEMFNKVFEGDKEKLTIIKRRGRNDI
jgi:hypothetical protein